MERAGHFFAYIFFVPFFACKWLMVRRDVMRRRVMVNCRHASIEDAHDSANVLLLINKAMRAYAFSFWIHPKPVWILLTKTNLDCFFFSENTCRKRECAHLIDAIVAGIHSKRPKFIPHYFEVDLLPHTRHLQYNWNIKRSTRFDLFCSALRAGVRLVLCECVILGNVNARSGALCGKSVNSEGFTSPYSTQHTDEHEL